MACGNTGTSATHSLHTTSTTVAYTWYTPWMPATGLDNIIAVMILTGLSGNFQAQLAIQTADVRPEAPNSPSLLGSAQTTTTPYCTGAVSVASSTASAMWVRFGIAANLTSGSALGQADVTLMVSDDRCGQAVGTATNTLSSTTTATNTFVAITGWIPAILANYVKAALVATALQGPIQWRLTMRTANTTPDLPNAWSTTFDTWRTTAGGICTGELATSISGAMYVQFGLQFILGSGSFGNVMVASTVAVRK